MNLVIQIEELVDLDTQGCRLSNKRHKTFPKEEQETDKDTIQKLRARLKKLEKENKNLSSQVYDLKKVLDKNVYKIKELTDDYKLEDILQKEAVKHKQKQDEQLSEKERTRKKFADLNKKG